MEQLRPSALRRTNHRRNIGLVLVGTDAVMLVLATLLATYLRFNTFDVAVSLENVSPSARPQYDDMSLFVAVVWLAFLWLGGLYDFDRLFWGAGEYSRVLRSLSLGLVGVILLTFALRMPGLSRAWTLLAWALAALFVTFGRLVIRAGLRRLRRRGKLQRPTLIVGSNPEAADLIRIVMSDPGNGLVVVGCLASSQAERLELDYCSDTVPVLGHARELPEIIQAHGIDTIIIASTAFDHEVIARIIGELRGLTVDIHISSGLFEVLTTRVLVRELSGVPVMTVKGVSLSASNLRTKRAFDLVIAGMFFLLGMPVWLLLALAIKFDSRGPVFYQQPRIGQHGDEFGMLKFRSMSIDADVRRAELAEHNEASGPLFKMKDDPRVTRVGKWMRKLSIDEFPQIINVLRGEMSLVGPRPPLPREVVEYTDHHWRRMEVPPGMTGLWQVSGRSALTFEEMVRLDLFYIENWSVGFDLSLILRTVPAVLLARGAY